MGQQKDVDDTNSNNLTPPQEYQDLEEEDDEDLEEDDGDSEYEDIEDEEEEEEYPYTFEDPFERVYAHLDSEFDDVSFKNSANKEDKEQFIEVKVELTSSASAYSDKSDTNQSN